MPPSLPWGTEGDAPRELRVKAVEVEKLGIPSRHPGDGGVGECGRYGDRGCGMPEYPLIVIKHPVAGARGEGRAGEDHAGTIGEASSRG